MPIVILAVWLAAGQGIEAVFSQTEIVIYFLLVIIVNSLTGAWGAWFIQENIRTGDFSRYLLKPFSILADYAVNNLNEKCYKIFIVLIIDTVLFYLLIGDFRQLIQLDFISIGLFLVSLAMAIVINFLLDMVMGLFAFWLQEIDFLKNSSAFAEVVFSGKLIPYAFLPPALAAIGTILPYRYIISFPIEVLLKKVEGVALVQGFAFQILWLLFFVLLYRLIYSQGVKTYQGFGG